MMRSQVLWVSAGPEPETRWEHGPAGWNVEIRPAEEAIEALAVTDYSAIVLELPYAGWRSAALLEAVQRAAPGVPVLARDPNTSVDEAVHLAHLGLHQFLPADEDGFRLIDRVIEDGLLGIAAQAARGRSAKIGSGCWWEGATRCGNFNIPSAWWQAAEPRY